MGKNKVVLADIFLLWLAPKRKIDRRGVSYHTCKQYIGKDAMPYKKEGRRVFYVGKGALMPDGIVF